DADKWTMTGEPAVLVDPFSATQGSTVEFRLPMNRTHSELVKFAAQDEDYERVLARLKPLDHASLACHGDSNYEQKIVECRELKGRGYFNEAAKRVRELLKSKPVDSSDVVIELADTLFLQGRYIPALESVEEHLSNSTENEPGANATLRMMRAFGRAHVQGVFNEGLELVQSYEGIRNYAIESELANTSSNTDGKFGIYARDRSAFDDMMSLGKYAAAGKVASISVFGGDSPVTIDLYQRLAFNDKTSPVVKAKALGWLASLRNERREKGKSRQVFFQARQAFQEIDHAYALAQLDVTEAYQEFTGEMIELEEPVSKFIGVCEDLLYYRGVLEATDDLRKTADRAKLTPISLQLSAQIESLAEQAGAKVLRDQARLKCIDAWNTLSDHSGKAINAATNVYESLEKSDCFTLRQKAAQFASKSYTKLKDKEQAVFWARKCVEESRRCSKLVQSAAVMAFIECEFLALSGPVDAREKSTAAMGFIQAEVENANHEIALSMLYTLEITLAAAKVMSGVDCSEYLPKVTQCIHSIKSQLPKPLEATQELSKSRSDISQEEEAIVLLGKARKMRLQANELSAAAGLHGLQGEIYHGIVAKFRTSDSHTDAELVRKYLRLALQQYSLAIGYFEASKQVTEIAKYKLREAQVLYESWGLGDVSHSVVLEKVHDAQVYSDRVRRELSVLGRLNAIENKRRLGAIRTTRTGFAIALHVTTHEGMALARSLCDLLGSDILVPKDLLAQIAADKEALALYEYGKQRLQHFEGSQSLSGISNQMELDEHVAKMRQNPLLKALVDLREGVPLSLSYMQQELHRLKEPLKGRDIVLVDWILRDDEVWMVTVKDSGAPTLDMLPITASAVKEWTDLHLQPSAERDSCIMSDEREEHHPMHELTPLVQRLVDSCHVEDILVLSPTEMLHSLPLHALPVLCENGRMLLIERNPIVYAASMTNFVQCCQKARDSPPKEDLAKSFVEAYEDFAGYEYDRAEQTSVQGLMTELAEETGGEYHHGQEVLFDGFSRIAERSRMLLFHGHCDLEADDIRSQGLRLPLPPGQKSGESVLFSVPSFFDLNLHHAPHITLMACASTVQAITPGDDPLGLVTALLCAGAASVLGTMWPVQSRTARVFAERFVANWDAARCNAGDSGDKGDDNENRKGKDEGLLNLAIAVREAVLDLREGVRTKEVWHWGGFVLHGSFFCRDV
ncbi:hypothetical protein MMC11_007077, partial [Xylographa trunciseda]|nr:hypothetical protein [Xylographa trunciseda]